MKSPNCSLVPSAPLKIEFYSYLVENSQKATLNFYFKSRFSVKPSKFQLNFENDCSTHHMGHVVLTNEKI